MDQLLQEADARRGYQPDILAMDCSACARRTSRLPEARACPGCGRYAPVAPESLRYTGLELWREQVFQEIKAL